MPKEPEPNPIFREISDKMLDVALQIIQTRYRLNRTIAFPDATVPRPCSLDKLRLTLEAVDDVLHEEFPLITDRLPTYPAARN